MSEIDLGAFDAVVFDLDDTLVAERGPAGRAFEETARIASDRVGVDTHGLALAAREEARRIWRTLDSVRAYCVDVGISSSEGLWAGFDGDDPNLTMLRAYRDDYRRGAWDRGLRRMGIEDPQLAGILAAAFVDKRAGINDVYPDVPDALSRLSGRVRLALLTNGAPDLQRRKIDASGLADRFDAIVISGEFGHGKPDPAIFRHTLAQLDVPASRALMIGDSLERDVAGARAAGMKTAWVNRDEPVRRDVPADFVLTDLS